MISEGRTVFQGAVQGLRATQNQELIVRPEKEKDVAPLMDLFRQNGFTAHARTCCRGSRLRSSRPRPMPPQC